jgi:iron complex transport system ATP-binding protein
LLLDEPTSHLDLANKVRLLKLMQELAARGATLLLTTHEPDVAAAIATHLVLMREGQVYQTGPLPQVFTAEHLSATYNVPVSVTQVDGRRIALWT